MHPPVHRRTDTRQGRLGTLLQIDRRSLQQHIGLRLSHQGRGRPTVPPNLWIISNRASFPFELGYLPQIETIGCVGRSSAIRCPYQTHRQSISLLEQRLFVLQHLAQAPSQVPQPYQDQTNSLHIFPL